VPEQITRTEDEGIVYDDVLLSHANSRWFDAAFWQGAAEAPGYAGGRGTTLYVELAGQRWVLRHFHRGGRIGRVLEDQFFWLGEDRTRSFREWRLLHRMHGLGLPSPQPVAARYRRRGLAYTADLLTACIPDVEPFSTRLGRGPVVPDVWRAVGACVHRFHAAGVWHADLTAHNLQIDRDDRIFLLDFDRGRFREPAGSWREANLQRLHRSLSKISEDGEVCFSAIEWGWLREGYGARA
jgi:3-deoxy-D-manno-octulosonic acid kinase